MNALQDASKTISMMEPVMMSVGMKSVISTVKIVSTRTNAHLDVYLDKLITMYAKKNAITLTVNGMLMIVPLTYATKSVVQNG